MSTAIIRYHDLASLPKGIEPLEYPEPQAKNPSDVSENTVDITYNARNKGLLVIFYRAHQAIASRRYSTVNNIGLPSVAQRMLHEIDDWLHHGVVPVVEEMIK